MGAGRVGDEHVDGPLPAFGAAVAATVQPGALRAFVAPPGPQLAFVVAHHRAHAVLGLQARVVDGHFPERDVGELALHLSGKLQPVSAQELGVTLGGIPPDGIPLDFDGQAFQGGGEVGFAALLLGRLDLGQRGGLEPLAEHRHHVGRDPQPVLLRLLAVLLLPLGRFGSGLFPAGRTDPGPGGGAACGLGHPGTREHLDRDQQARVGNDLAGKAGRLQAPGPVHPAPLEHAVQLEAHRVGRNRGGQEHQLGVLVQRLDLLERTVDEACKLRTPHLAGQAVRQVGIGLGGRLAGAGPRRAVGPRRLHPGHLHHRALHGIA